MLLIKKGLVRESLDFFSLISRSFAAFSKKNSEFICVINENKYQINSQKEKTTIMAIIISNYLFN